MALRPVQIQRSNPAANLAGIDVGAGIAPLQSATGVIKDAVKTGEGFEKLREEDAVKRVLAEDTESILEGDAEAFNRLIALPGGREAATSIIELGKTRDAGVLSGVTTSLTKNKVFNSMALKETNTDTLRKTIRAEAQKRLGAGDMDGAEELLNISQLPTLDAMQGELSADLAIADAGLAALQSVSSKSKANFQKTRTFLIEDDKGNTKIITGVFDPNTGAITTSEGSFKGKILSAEGETPAEAAAREAATAGAKKRAEQEAIADTAGDIEVEKETARRGQRAIDDAYQVGEGIPVLNRSLELLDSVATGGFNNAKIRAKQMFGIESADEGELSNLLGKAVLQQLRVTFGAAFTAEEGNSLKEIEAGLSSNPEANRRLLQNAKELAQRTIKRGIREARKAGAEEDALELEALLEAKFEFDDEKLPEGVTEQDISDTLAANPGLTREDLMQRLKAAQ